MRNDSPSVFPIQEIRYLHLEQATGRGIVERAVEQNLPKVGPYVAAEHTSRNITSTHKPFSYKLKEAQGAILLHLPSFPSAA